MQSVCSWRKRFQGLRSPFSWNSIAKTAPLFLETFEVDQHLGSRCFATRWVAFVTFQLPVPAACQSAVSPSSRCCDGASHRPTSVTCLHPSELFPLMLVILLLASGPLGGRVTSIMLLLVFEPLSVWLSSAGRFPGRL